MNATLFMPDISGFTKFVKSTEQEHSRHIISELINIVIKDGRQYFEVAEVEGDAVFFYQDEVYYLPKIESIAKSIYNKFHAHLAKYEHKRICDCGACTTAVDLKIKFIVHSGEISLIDYGNKQQKPFGEPVIIAHRLLKSKIGFSEYILYSDAFLDKTKGDFDGVSHIDDSELGKIGFKYKLIEDWLDVISIDDQINSEIHTDIVVVQKKSIKSEMKTLHSLLVNFKYRHYWNKGVDKLIFDPNEINQVGTEHRCIVDGKDLHFDTIKPTVESSQLSYGEILKNPSPFTYFEADYFLDPIGDNKTELTMQMRVNLKNRVQKLLAPIFRFFLKRQVKKVLKSIEQAIPEIQEAA